ncbi:MAG: hypothetical protein H6Q74_1729 [Firmicutes bacterium]|nr:hypothetical protein [Bacillota bacterium]
MIWFILGLLIGAGGIAVIAADVVDRIISKVEAYIQAMDKNLTYNSILILEELRIITGRPRAVNRLSHTHL